MRASVDESIRPPGERPLLDRIAELAVVPRGPACRWGFALGTFAVATAARFAMDAFLPTGFPFLTFYPAVLYTAFFAGALEGTVIAALCMAVAWFVFIPLHHPSNVYQSQLLALFLYVFIVGSEIVVVQIMRRALRRLAVAEAAARETAKNRSLMFSELQHRVSNNLAVVGSLLTLQRREVSDPSAAKALDEAAARINVVSRLNRLLHDPKAQEIDFGAFLRAMVPDAVEASGIGDRIAVTVAAEPVVVPAEKAVPLGLVATELLANALEHAFADGRRGEVCVTLDRLEEGQARLAIRDNGAGLPPGFSLERARSLGLIIARQFAGQLGAKLSIADEGGVVSRLEVPLGA